MRRTLTTTMLALSAIALLIGAIACGGNSNTQPGAHAPDDKAPTHNNPAGRVSDAPAIRAVGIDPDELASGRLPFPHEGETFSEPIPARRLQGADPFTLEIDPEDIPEVVPWDEAGQYVGHEITVEGRIVNLGKSGNVNFLNYHRDWRGKFYLVIFDDLAQTLDGSVEETFLNKLIRVTGEVEEHRGRPQIRILSMEQVEFVAEEGEDDEGGEGDGG